MSMTKTKRLDPSVTHWDDREKKHWDDTIFCTLFQNILDNFSLNNDQIAVAVSGGIDSIVLLHLIANWAKENHRSLPIALTVNHGLRPESQKEADFVANYAKKLGVESFILNWNKTEYSNVFEERRPASTTKLPSEAEFRKRSIQSQAREARYRLLTEWCKNNNVKHLFVAHHRDDQAETFLLRLERGSGIDGLSSMDCKSCFNGVCILRPLLEFSRGDIEKYAKFHQLKWVEDRSNQDLKYRRTLYRNLLKTSENQEILTERIYLTTLHMKRAAKALMHYTRLTFDECINVHDLGYIEIKLSKFHQLPEEIALRVFLYSIMAIGSKSYKPRYNSLIAIFNKMLQKDCDINLTLSGCKIKKYEENILIIRESSKIQEMTINLPLNEPIVWDNRFSCTILGDHECSVTIAPLKKTQKIPEFLKNYNCCPEVFYSLPVVQKDGKVLAYPCIDTTSKNINSDEIQCIINSIIKENLVSLTDI